MADIRSMTGFGRYEEVTEDHRILVEIKSVNHRYLDLSVKMPRRLNCFEARIRQLLRDYLERGKTDIYIAFEDYGEGAKKLKYNEGLAAEYVACARKMEESFGIQNDLKVSGLMRLPEVLVMEDTGEDDEELWEIIGPAVGKAAESFSEARRKEGENLRKDLLEKLGRMKDYVRDIEDFSPSVVEEYRRRLTEKIRETRTTPVTRTTLAIRMIPARRTSRAIPERRTPGNRGPTNPERRTLGSPGPTNPACPRRASSGGRC